MTDIEQFGQRLDRVESELAIRRLAYEYCHGADKRDPARWAAVWSDDAVWAVSPDQEIVGVEAICAAVAGQWDFFRQMHHFTANHVVTIDGDDATGEADVAVSAEMADGTWIRGGAVYGDRYVRRSGTWRIARREAGSDFYYSPLPPGVGPRPDES
ncbi:MAG: nuclear transport factor 2 family protein [Geodermatophilaceae bacterium]|nr:nuclear transport factor 2 family protein [Geodermatophilaceae bacterium]